MKGSSGAIPISVLAFNESFICAIYIICSLRPPIEAMHEVSETKCLPFFESSNHLLEYAWKEGLLFKAAAVLQLDVSYSHQAN